MSGPRAHWQRSWDVLIEGMKLSWPLSQTVGFNMIRYHQNRKQFPFSATLSKLFNHLPNTMAHDHAIHPSKNITVVETSRPKKEKTTNKLAWCYS